jgi:hypothetical protein
MKATKNHIEQWMENEKKETTGPYKCVVRELGKIDVFYADGNLFRTCYWEEDMFSILYPYFKDSHSFFVYSLFTHRSKQNTYYIDFSFDQFFYRFTINEGNSRIFPVIYKKDSIEKSYDEYYRMLSDKTLINIWEKMRHILSYIIALPKYRLKIAIRQMQNPLLCKQDIPLEDELIKRGLITEKIFHPPYHC